MAEGIGHPFWIFSSGERIAREGVARLVEDAASLLAAIAELERNIIVERIRGGIRRAKEQGKRLGRRPLADPSLLRTVLQMKAQGKSIRAIAEAVKVSKSFVHKTCKSSGSQTVEIPAC